MENVVLDVPRMNDAQMKALELLIVMSRDVKGLTARSAIMWLLRKTDGLTKSVVLNIPIRDTEEDRIAGEIQNSFHDLNSAVGTTHMRYILRAMGSPARFSHHDGSFDPSGGEQTFGSRIWIGTEFHDPGAQRFDFDAQEIASIEFPTH